MTEGLDDLLTLREATHGSCLERARILYKLKETYPHDPLLLNALDLILDKISRLIAGDETFVDHWTDISGCARLAEDYILNHLDGPVRQLKLMGA